MTKRKIIISSILGCMLTFQLGAFSVVLETLASGITELPFTAFLAAMQPIHLVIGLIEGLITSAVLVFVYQARPELLFCSSPQAKGHMSFYKTLAVLTIAAAGTGGILSLFASSYPDGLEWSIKKLTGSTELQSAGGVYRAAHSIQETTALLPDYAFTGSESAFGTIFSGIIGGLIVIAVCVLVCYIFKFFRKRNQHEQN